MYEEVQFLKKDWKVCVCGSLKQWEWDYYLNNFNNDLNIAVHCNFNYKIIIKKKMVLKHKYFYLKTSANPFWLRY